MKDMIIFNELLGNAVSLIRDGVDFEVRLNDNVVIATGDETEAEMIAESLDVALNLLYSQDLLKENCQNRK